jgi:hypothetical protein
MYILNKALPYDQKRITQYELTELSVAVIRVVFLTALLG